MTPAEARSLGRAIRAARLEKGLTQLKLAVAIGVKSPWISAWERGQSQPSAYREAVPPASISRDQLQALSVALGCTIESIANRAALSATTRVAYGLEPLGPARTLVGGHRFDLTDAEADRVVDFISGLISGRDLH